MVGFLLAISWYNYYVERNYEKHKRSYYKIMMQAYVNGVARPEYIAWIAMKQRCENPAHPGFKYWGGRGIVVCARWRNSFAAFVSDMGPRPEGMTLDRIDNDGNYEPGNCRWTTWKAQLSNRRK